MQPLRLRKSWVIEAPHLENADHNQIHRPEIQIHLYKPVKSNMDVAQTSSEHILQA